MENRIKEQQLDLFADRTSAATMRANQLRLWFASFAYVLLEVLRRIGLRHTQFQDATCGTIRLKLLKLGAKVTVSGELGRGEHKSMQTDRVILVPGPADEVETVRRMYRAFVEEGKLEREIAASLNSRGIATDPGNGGA